MPDVDVTFERVRSAPIVLGEGLRSLVARPSVQRLLALGLFEAAFYVAYRYGMSFSQASASPFWFPDSILLCGLLLTRPRHWWILVLGALPIRLFSEVAQGIPLWFLLTTFAIDSAKGLLTATAMRRFIKDPIRIDTVRDFAIFCLWAVLLMPAASALAGAAARHALGHEFWPAWEQWFLGNALTHLVVTPAILYWVFGAPWKMKAPSRARCLEAGLLAVGLVVTGDLAFETQPGRYGFFEPRFYAPIPLLFWAAVRFGMVGASGAIVAIAAVSVHAALQSHGPFSGQSPVDAAAALQHFLLLRAAALYLVAILIEQRGAVEHSLRESQERASLAATAADLSLWEWDIVRDKAWRTTPGRAQLDSASPAPMNFDGLMRLLHPDDRETVARGLAKCMNGHDTFEGKYRIVRPDGESRWVSSIGRVEFDAAGKPVRLRGVSRDITRSQQLEQLVQRQREELDNLARLAALAELSGSLAHELHQPLTAILMNARAAQRFLDQDGPNLDEVRAILADVVADDQRAAEIIRRLRQLFKKGEVQRQPTDVNRLVRQVMRLAHSELMRKEIDVHTELAADLSSISGDGVQLQQVLLNLVTNACEAMADSNPRGRRLVVRTAPAVGDGVHVAVSDRGLGIPRDDLERIFEPFFTSRPDGMGLGLTVCRTIIHAHRGRIWAENNAEGGASFHFTLPGPDRDQH